MKTLYLQCAMGAAGDMLMAALYELLEEEARAQFLADMNALGIPGVKIAAAPAQKCGIWGTHMEVTVHGAEEHAQDAHLHFHAHPPIPAHSHGHCGKEGCCGQMRESAEVPCPAGEENREHPHCPRGDHAACVHSHEEGAAQGHAHEHAPAPIEQSSVEQGHGSCHSRALQAEGQNFDLTAPVGQDAGGGHSHCADAPMHGHCHGEEGAHSHEHGCHPGEAHAHRHEHTHGLPHPQDHGHTHAHPEGPAHTHSHSGMAEIQHLLAHLPLSEAVRENALAVYRLIAEAESHAHGQPISEIHFHEVGTLDAVADVVGVCLLMERIGAQKVLASPVHVGSGQVRCAHGVLPVPAPATAHILRGVPTYGGEVRGELCTPTGAALLRHFAQSFGPMPPLRASAIGYGMGTKDFEAANCVRAFLGEDGAGQGGPNGEIALLCCNLDDMTGEALGFAEQALFEAGALDVYTLPIQMKKSRPGVLLCCICELEAADELAAQMLRHTTTFGVRRSICQRYMLSRTFEEAPTPYGPLRIKKGAGYGVQKCKLEYEEAARLARERKIPLSKVLECISRQS